MARSLDKYSYLIVLGILFLAGCSSTSGNVGQVQSYAFTQSEAPWIKNGEPIEFEGAFWYPQDGIEVLLDSEVNFLGEYKGVAFFSDKVDVRPYKRLYTKFGRNQFRYYEKQKNQ